MHRSLTASYIAASFRFYSALTAILIATLPRYIPRRQDIGSIETMLIRRGTLTAKGGRPIL